MEKEIKTLLYSPPPPLNCELTFCWKQYSFFKCVIYLIHIYQKAGPNILVWDTFCYVIYDNVKQIKFLYITMIYSYIFITQNIPSDLIEF